MRASPWDLIAPAYWTEEQSRVLSDTRCKRRLSFAAIREQAQRRRRRQVIAWSLYIMFLLMLLILWEGSESSYKFLQEQLPWLPSWPRHLLSWLPLSGLRIMFLVQGLCFLAGAVTASMMKDAVSPMNRQARSLRVFLARRATRTAGTGLETLLAADLAARRRWWSRKLGENVTRAVLADRLAPLRAVTLSGMALLFFLFALGADAWGAEHAEVIILGCAVLLISVYWLAAQAPVRRVRLHDALQRAWCADCGFDLSGLRPAIDPARLDGQNIGPERCPECGSLWPLLPPPLSPTGCALRLSRFPEGRNAELPVQDSGQEGSLSAEHVETPTAGPIG